MFEWSPFVTWCVVIAVVVIGGWATLNDEAYQPDEDEDEMVVDDHPFHEDSVGSGDCDYLYDDAECGLYREQHLMSGTVFYWER